MIRVTYYHTLYERDVTVNTREITFEGTDLIFAVSGHRMRLPLERVRAIKDEK